MGDPVQSVPHADLYRGLSARLGHPVCGRLVHGLASHISAEGQCGDNRLSEHDGALESGQEGARDGGQRALGEEDTQRYDLAERECQG